MFSSFVHDIRPCESGIIRGILGDTPYYYAAAYLFIGTKDLLHSLYVFRGLLP